MDDDLRPEGAMLPDEEPESVSPSIGLLLKRPCEKCAGPVAAQAAKLDSPGLPPREVTVLCRNCGHIEVRTRDDEE